MRTNVKQSYLSLVLLLVVTSFVTTMLVACGSYSEVKNSKKESLYDRVIRSGKLRCAYVVYPPGVLKDPNTGKLSGVGVDAIELVAKKLGLAVEWVEEVGWGTMLEGLQTNRYDLLATPVWTNAKRAKIIDFSKPLFYSPIFAYVKKGDHRFKDHLEKINAPNVKIATIDGSTEVVIAQEDFPKAQQFSMPQLTDNSQVLLNVATGKADVTFVEPCLSYLYFQHNPKTLEVLDPVHPVRLFPDCWMFNRGEPEFKAMIDTVLDEVINSGTMDKIISKYEPAPNLIYRVALPYKMPHTTN